LTTLPQITIGAVEGKARGAGNEFLSSLDMLFGTTTHTVLSSPEIALGILPGGGGIQFLTRLIGSGRAMEYILTATDIGAVEAAQIGWINKAFETTEAMNSHIDNLISRLLLFSPTALALSKQAISAAARPQLSDLLADSDRFLQTLSDPQIPELIGKVLRLSNNQSNETFEQFLGENIPLVYE
tara:strand:- start:1825 stop:2376 length:552 start_codon:yes stop_codon:yes gene_type:complete